MAPKKKPATAVDGLAPLAKDGKTPLTCRRYQVRATSVGYANETLYEAGDEFLMIIWDDIFPPRWVEILDDGEPVDINKEPKPLDPMAADVAPLRRGFAAKIAAPGAGEVI